MWLFGMGRQTVNHQVKGERSSKVSAAGIDGGRLIGGDRNIVAIALFLFSVSAVPGALDDGRQERTISLIRLRNPSRSCNSDSRNQTLFLTFI